MATKFGVLKISEDTIKGLSQGVAKNVGSISSPIAFPPVFSGIDKTVETDGDAEDIIVIVDYFIGYIYDTTTPATSYNIVAIRGDTSAATYNLSVTSAISIGAIQVAYPEGKDMVMEIVHFFATT